MFFRGKKDLAKGDYFKIFFERKNKDAYYIKFETLPGERNLYKFDIFEPFFKRNFSKEILFKTTDEIFDKLKPITKKI